MGSFGCPLKQPCFLLACGIPQAFFFLKLNPDPYTLLTFRTSSLFMTSSTVHLLLPREEALQLSKSGAVQLLYPIAELSALAGQFRCDASTSAQFPARDQLSALPAEPAAPWVTTPVEDHGWSDVLNAGRLWNFLGDATHSTPVLQVPFGLVQGQALTVENRYNVPPLPAQVARIELVRLQGGALWFWLLELRAPGG